MENNVVEALYETYRVMEVIINKRLKIGITMTELHILETIKKLTPKQENINTILAQSLYIKPSSSTHAVNILVKKGYLKRNTSKKDRRIIYIELSNDGIDLIEKVRKQNDEIVESIIEKLKINNLDTLKVAFNQYYLIIKKFKSKILNTAIE
jgi:DNA-binding MarR family transcriptional regulator